MKKKILMVVGKFYPEISGGNLQCKKIIDTLSDDFEFKILTFTNRKKIRVSKNLYNITRLKLHGHNVIKKFNLFIKILIFFLKEKKNFSIVHIFGISNVNILIIILSKLLNKKILVKFSSFGEDDLETVKKKSIINYLLHKYLCDALISNAPIFHQKAKKFNVKRSKLMLIKNFLLVNRKPQRKKNIINFNNNFKTVLSVGHFSRDKRNDFTFQVWKETFLKGYKSNIIFVGNSSVYNHEVDSTIKKNIFKEVLKLNIKKNIRFIEFDQEMGTIYKNADIFLLTTKREGVPNALLEALYYGLNCVCSKLPSIKKFLEFYNLNYVDLNADLKIWSEALIKQLKKRKKNKINKQVSIKFNNSKIAKDYYYLYKKI